MSQSTITKPVVPLLMPEAGNSMEEGTILQWSVSVGDQIAEGDIVCEIETDKAAIEYESPTAGRLARIVAEEGDTIPVKEPIAYFADSDADLDQWLGSQASTTSKPATDPSAQPSAGVNQSTAGAPTPTVAGTSSEAGSRRAVSPAARRMAREQGIDLSSVASGSGPAGRILSTDLEGIDIHPPLQVAAAADNSGTRRPLSKMRRTIGQRLQQSKQTIPHFYVRSTVRADRLYATYKQQADTTGCTLNDIIVLACGRTLAEFPAFRSRLDGDSLVEEPGSHVGIAVGVDDSLVVPVVLDVQNMSLDQLAARTSQIVKDARDGKVAGLGRGVFTISNLGMFGVEEFSAIINPPEAAILAVAAVREAVIVENGWMRPGRVMTLNLSCDHRVVDGVAGAKFMARLKELLEAPEQLVTV